MKGGCAYFHIREDIHGREFMVVNLDGIALLRLVLTNKGTAFTPQERRALKLDGLLPPEYNTLQQQVDRVYHGFQELPSPIAKYQFLRALQERQEILFYALLGQHMEEMMPIVYTPTVGEAVQRFHSLYQNPRGLSLSPLNIGDAEDIVGAYTMDDVKMIVVTDSSAILGIGDQGYGGLAIPIGKLALYVVGGGVSPFHTCPISLDVGTNRDDLIADPFYLGVRQKRLTGEAYYQFVDAFVHAVRKKWPGAIIQWEDLAKETAFAVLQRYRDVVPSFNDDIQGTGAVALAGVLSACRKKGVDLADQKIVIHGAGAGGIGVAWALKQGLVEAGLSEEEAFSRVFVLDSRGLLVEGRKMEAYKQSFAQKREVIADWVYTGDAPDLLETIQCSGSSVLIGLSGRPAAFTAEIVHAVAKNDDRPIVFPLSNPTSSSEAHPSDVIRWTHGRAIIATGSPFQPVDYEGERHMIGQGNNAFIFPGLGFGAILCRATKVTDGMVLEASHALSDYTAERWLDQGLIYPPIEELKEVSIRVAARVIQRAVDEGAGTMPKVDGKSLEDYVRSKFWEPKYLPFVRADKLDERHIDLADHHSGGLQIPTP